MTTTVDSIHIYRIQQVNCIYECVNLNLVVVNRALSGDKELATRINKVGERLHDAYLHEAEMDVRYHSFVVSHYFISLVSEFEGFLIDILRTIVRKYPSKIGSVSLKVSDIVPCANLDEAIDLGIGRYLNELVYKRPKEYVQAITEVLSLPTSDELVTLWKQFVEFKARRDLGVHNDWEVNETYVRKVNEVGLAAPAERFLAPDNEYFVKAVDVIIQLMKILAGHSKEKFE